MFDSNLRYLENGTAFKAQLIGLDSKSELSKYFKKDDFVTGFKSSENQHVAFINTNDPKNPQIKVFDDTENLNAEEWIVFEHIIEPNSEKEN